MTPGQQNKMNSLADGLAQLSEDLDVDEISNLYAAFHVEDDNCILRVNTEGAVYFAAMLMSLAKTQKVGQHYHYDEMTVLQRSDKKLVLQFDLAPWESPET